MNILLAPNPAIFYILAVICFCAFLVGLMWYIFSVRKNSATNKQTKSWTIESAKKFLESQNIDTTKSQSQNNENVTKVVENKEVKTTRPKNMPENKTTKVKNEEKKNK